MDSESQTSVEELIANLQSNDRSIRGDAVRKLGRMRADQAFTAICEMLETEADFNVKSQAIKALGRFGRVDAIPILLSHFDACKPAVIGALIKLGVFDHVMPKCRRERRQFRYALQGARPELKTLIEQGRLSRDDLRQVLPNIM